MIFMLVMTESFKIPLIGTVDFADGSASSVAIAAVIALLWASLLGLINGLIFAWSRIPSFIVTLGTLFAYRAISLTVIAGGRILRYRDTHPALPQVTINRWFMIIGALALLVALLYTAYRALPRIFQQFVESAQRRTENGSFGTTIALMRGLWLLITTAVFAIFGLWLGLVAYFHFQHRSEALVTDVFGILSGRWTFTLNEVSQGQFSIVIPPTANFQNTIIWWVLMVILFQIILVHTRYGNAVFAVGGNIGAATAQGIRATRLKVQNFVLCSFLAGVAAIFETARNPGVDPLKGNQWELEVIAMTVIGGALLSGGYGSIIGTMLGVLIFGMLQTGLVLVGMDQRMFQGVIGVIMIIAVVLNNITKRR
jgi:ribose/xylose/arabinose/galactoside ABC-type transport system permease subunit